MPWCSPGTSGSVVNPGTLRRVTHVSPDRRNNHKVKASHMLNWRKTRKKTHNHSNTHMASWKLIAFWPATALSWGLHLILMISSSGSLSPLSTGYLQFMFSISHVSTSLSVSHLTRRQSQVCPCSSHSRTPHSSSLTRSSRNTSPRVVAAIWQPAVTEASSRTGGAEWPGGSLSTEENLDCVSIFRQWISATGFN